MDRLIAERTRSAIEHFGTSSPGDNYFLASLSLEQRGRAAMGLVKIALVALGYLALSKISFLTSYSAHPAGPSPIWLPTGFATAALLLLGMRMWIGVALGTLAMSNLLLGLPLLTGLGINLANVLEPVIAVLLLRSQPGFDRSLSRLGDVLVLVWAAAICSTAVSATVGVINLLIFGFTQWGNFAENWWYWWVANVLSDLIFAPFILLWFVPFRFVWSTKKALELGVVAVLSAGVFGFVFLSSTGSRNMPFAYWFYPFVVWVAIRFDLRATVAVIATFTGAAIWVSVLGLGPLFVEDRMTSLAYLQSFLAVLATTGMSLAAVVQERRRTEEELRTAIGIRDEFLSIASHELKTPITSLSLQLQMISREIDRGEQAKLVKISTGQMARLTRLIDELLDVSRISTGRLIVQPQNVDLKKLVTEVADHIRPEIEAANCSLRLDLQPQITGHWDPLRLEQVIINLLSNALKYAAGKPIALTTRVTGPNVEIEVQDQGMGISERDQRTIFERYVRGVSMRSYGGFGLGLYIARNIAEAHGGTIVVSSEPGKGACFVVSLPLKGPNRYS